MRQLKSTQKGRKARDAPRELMVEEPTKARKRNPCRRFSEEESEVIANKRGELMKKGLTDNAIAYELSKEMDRSHDVLLDKIRRSVKEGALPPNPNALLHYTESEIESVASWRDSLCQKGMNDKQIARVIAKESKGKVENVYSLIQRMVQSRRFDENPNKRVFFTAAEEERIVKARNRFAAKGMTDNKIAKTIAPEFRKSAPVMAQVIRRLMKNGILGENPNKKRFVLFTDTQNRDIVVRYRKLTALGLNDYQIAKKLSEETGRCIGTILEKLKSLRRSSAIIRNRNKRSIKSFGDPELKRLIRIRNELAGQGDTDGAIAKKISADFGRSEKTIASKISRLVDSGRLGKNPNKRVKCSMDTEQRACRPKESEILKGLAQAAEAMEQFGDSG